MTIQVQRPSRWRWWETVRGFVRRYHAELAVAAAATVGWFLIVAGTALVLGGAVVWWFGIGLYLMALAGFRYIGLIAWTGLYALTRPPPPDTPSPMDDY